MIDMIFMSRPQEIDFEKHETSNCKLEPWNLTIFRFQKLSINQKASVLYISHCKGKTTTSHINIRFFLDFGVTDLNLNLDFGCRDAS